MIGMGMRSYGVFSCIGLAGILALAVTGTRDASLREAMSRHADIAREINGLLDNHKTAAQAEEMQRRREELKNQIEDLYRVATEINLRETLMPDIFPAGEKAQLRVRFAELYRTEIDQLPGMLQAGAPPTPVEIDASRADLAEWLKADRIEEKDSPADLRRPRPGITATKPDLVTRYLQMMKARRLRCYVDEQAFDRAPLYATDTTPTVEELWFAQVGLWIQRDVVEGISELNADAARKVGRGASVAEMPVKRIERLYVLGYQLESRLLPFPAGQVQSYEQHLAAQPSFTQRKCDGDFDVVVFRLVAVIDQRDLPQLVDRISKRNFYQCTTVGFGKVAECDANAGYLYGPEPAIRIDLEFEAYLWREIYEDLIPDKIKQLLAS